MASLHGLRVVEIGSFIAGPFAGQLLGDHGAEVIKVEPPTSGDPMRRWGVVRDGESLWWPSIARNKRSVALDLRTPDGRDVLRRLVTNADILLENFRPGTLARWGMDFAALSADNPQLIVVHVSGYGQTGPLASAPGFGSIGEAMGGIRHTTGTPDRPSSRAGVSLGDALAALFAVIGALAAVNERHRSGRGQEVDVAIFEAVAAIMESTMADYHVAGVTRARHGSVLPGVVPSNAYPTADGAEVIIAANADAIFRRLCTAMSRPELADDERFADHLSRAQHMEPLDDLITTWTSQLDTEALIEHLRAHEVPVGQIFTAPDMLEDSQYRARGMIEWLTNRAGVALPVAGIVPKLSRTGGRIRDVGPVLGQHTHDVLTTLAGVTDEEWMSLHERGIVEQAGRPRLAELGELGEG